jgi:hypothetical protein
MPRLFLAAAVSLVLSLPLFADETPALHQPGLSTHYDGGYPSDFPAELSLVQTLLNTAPLEISSQLGVTQYMRGFHYPVAVRFDDGAPAITENSYFYLEPTNVNKRFSQTLVVNVEAFATKARRGTDTRILHDAFFYMITQLILNDLAGGDTDRGFPLWAQEGTALYLSGMGEGFVQKVAQDVPRSRVSELTDDLNRPFPILTPRQYARYYLAVKYIVAQGGTTNLQALIRDLTNNRSAADAVRDVLGQEWPDFQRHVKAYAMDEFTRFAPADADYQPPTIPSNRLR